jgi:hypothetical protein
MKYVIIGLLHGYINLSCFTYYYLTYIERSYITMGMFKKGYKAVEEEKKRQDENQAKAGKNIWRFFIADADGEADVRFLTEEPVTFYEHTIKSMRNGKEHFDQALCTQDDNCGLCAQGDKATFKGAYLIWDTRPFEYTDTNGKKKKANGQMRLYVQGAKILSQVARLSTKYGITNRTITIARLGKGKKTSYTLERGDEEPKFTKAEITNMLPEALRPLYNGTMDSLCNIIEESLSATLEENGNPSYDSEEEDDDDEYDNRKNLVSDDDDEEDYKPTKTPSLKGKPSLKKKPAETSVKKLFKSKR